MRQQYLNDGIEHFDFHAFRKVECKKLSRLILQGDYVPERAQRILVEKSKGLCRQLVIPSAKDALVLQCLSDALYSEVRHHAPTDRAFFEPQEQHFSTMRSKYGTMAAWLNFQRELFKFSRNRDFIVITDIANYYDSISYTHLRNVISSISGANECVLDMLIHVLSSLLWQPDYMPLVDIGLPQINIDAPRLLAHCFLYELDAFLGNDPSRDFVRYMDDIDVGVDSVAEAKRILMSIDLVLQTKQVRLNAGKTMILSRIDALKHFCILENARLDLLRNRIDRKIERGDDTSREKRLVEARIRQGLKKKKFNVGNGEKILKRLIGFAGKLGAVIPPDTLHELFVLRPSIRENVCVYIRRKHLTAAQSRILAEISETPSLVDHAAKVDLANHLVETVVNTKSARHGNICRIMDACDPQNYFGLYCRLWLQSKYASTLELLDTIKSNQNVWGPHLRLGRLIGAFLPLFKGASEEDEYRMILAESRNDGFRDTCKFHIRLSSDPLVFNSMFDALKNPNPSRGTGITHAKFLCLLSALQNQTVAPMRIHTLRTNNSAAWQDIYYRQIARRLGV